MPPTESGETVHQCCKLLSLEVMCFAGTDNWNTSISIGNGKKMPIPQNRDMSYCSESTEGRINEYWKICEINRMVKATWC